MAFEARQQRPRALLAELVDRGPADLAYLPVKLQGHYRNGQDFLLDNRIQGGKYGNEVLTVFELDNGELALVNRGWIIADPARRSLPDVPTVSPQAVAITGQVYVSPGDPYLLAEQELTGSWPLQVQAVDMAKMAAAIGVPESRLFPYPVRIDAGQSGALSVDWQVLNSSPEKHRGYAVQWFALSAALLIIYIVVNLKKSSTPERESP